MGVIIDPYTRREFGDCFYLEMPLDCSAEEIRARIYELTKVEKAVKRMLDGEISVNDLLEEIEPIITEQDLDMDEYASTVEDNMEYTLLYLP